MVQAVVVEISRKHDTCVLEYEAMLKGLGLRVSGLELTFQKSPRAGLNVVCFVRASEREMLNTMNMTEHVYLLLRFQTCRMLMQHSTRSKSHNKLKIYQCSFLAANYLSPNSERSTRSHHAEVIAFLTKLKNEILRSICGISHGTPGVLFCCPL